ncbi:GNAT family N-acetyltransferase [Chromobacterium sp. IIBBL 290-4]|uniref:GNAT family N-acetyltransferase n=1 Tax=Chromobacterium sp. IIBBL 290-4 TaxID=2953890 RepID=UPI0020B86D1D|nr:N-acetyltransferase [Chromobacterium sp. IIBBL 290-4]UTH74447.1 N-acetyltransferase [Chromobacterium sp. IIBBL 290-4]
MTITIRNEQSTDIGAISVLTEAAFRDEPHSSHTEQFIVDALRRRGQLAISLVADDGGGIVGHVTVSPVTVSGGAAGWYGLGPISVSPARHKQGIGGQLMREALRMLREQGAQGCVVLGDPAYYGRFGFRQQPGLVLPGIPAEYFQAQAFGAATPLGEVAYDEAFNAIS